MRIIDMSARVRATHRNRIERRIAQLRRAGWKWVKHGPQEPNTMCAVVDARAETGYYCTYRLEDDTMYALNDFLGYHTNGRWQNIVDYNDSPEGAKSVDDVVAVMEKFVAEL